jgi:hypothetical protein
MQVRNELRPLSREITRDAVWGRGKATTGEEKKQQQ